MPSAICWSSIPGIRIRLAGWPPRCSGSGRVQADPDLDMPYVHQASIGLERAVTQTLMLQASYMRMRGYNQLRSRNVNAPDEFGVRPEPGDRHGHADRIDRPIGERPHQRQRDLPFARATDLHQRQLHLVDRAQPCGQSAVAPCRQPQPGRGMGACVAGRAASVQRDGEYRIAARGPRQHRVERRSRPRRTPSPPGMMTTATA